jgi:hypothetical protein
MFAKQMLWVVAVVAMGMVFWTGAAQADYTGDWAGSGYTYGANNLTVGNNQNVTITSGSLSGTGKLYIGGGTGYTVTLDGTGTSLADDCTNNWDHGWAFFLQGTSNTFIIRNGAQFTAKGYDSIKGTSNVLRVTGAGSYAGFSIDNSDGLGFDTPNKYTPRVYIQDGGRMEIYGSGLCDSQATIASGEYIINVDGKNAVFSPTQFAYYGSGNGGIVQCTNGGALESLSTNLRYDNDDVAPNIRIDGGTMAYRNVSGVNMLESITDPGSTGNHSVYWLDWAGHNAFRLDNASSSTTDPYTFANNLGANHYARLELVNGTTSVANDITIDGAHGGSMLVDPTTATIHGDLLLTGAAVLEFAIEDPTKATYSQIIGADGGALTLAGTLLLDFSGGTYNLGWTSTPLFAGTYASSHSGTFDTVTATGLDYPWMGAEFNSDLTVTVMPEPATMALLGLGGLGLLLSRKRK